MKNKKILCTCLLLLFTFKSFGQNEIESLMINWPEEYQWKVGSQQEDQSVHLLELIPGKEEINNWTIIGTMLSIKGAKNVPMEVAMNAMHTEAKKNAPNAKLTLIEKNEEEEHHWVLFKIESPKFTNDKKPESQLYYIIQGNSSLYSNFVAVKKKKLSASFVKKWSSVFKSSQLVYN